ATTTTWRNIGEENTRGGLHRSSRSRGYYYSHVDTSRGGSERFREVKDTDPSGLPRPRSCEKAGCKRYTGGRRPFLMEPRQVLRVNKLGFGERQSQNMSMTRTRGKPHKALLSATETRKR
ncbi:hypothetical protein V1478_018771, partial [Vespula squamosa]